MGTPLLKTSKIMKQPKFRSGLEKEIASLLTQAGIQYRHESETLRYNVPAVTRKYLPDFVLLKCPVLVVEAKGRFTSADRQKMLLVKQQHPTRTIVIIFGRSQNTLSKKSKTTYGEWTTKNGIKWIDIKQLKQDPTCLLRLKTINGQSSNQPTKKS